MKNECCFEENRRVLEIVKNQIGCAALGDDVPDDMPLIWFRELYERIWDEATKSPV